MKGTFFQKPFEFNLDVPGEQWFQGQELKGTLRVTNHAPSSDQFPENLGIALAIGKNKKVKAKSSDAFEIVDTVSLSSSDQVNFNFKLPINGPISDKTQSYYLVYGDLAAKEGHLQLNVDSSLTFKPLLDVLDIFFRFKLKEKKFNKKSIEFKFIAPDAKEFKQLDTLILNMSEDEDLTIHINATFNLKNVGITDGNVAVQKTKATKKLQLTSKDYLFQKDSPNQDAIRKVFQSLFDDISPNKFF